MNTLIDGAIFTVNCNFTVTSRKDKIVVMACFVGKQKLFSKFILKLVLKTIFPTFKIGSEKKPLK